MLRTLSTSRSALDRSSVVQITEWKHESHNHWWGYTAPLGTQKPGSVQATFIMVATDSARPGSARLSPRRLDGWLLVIVCSPWLPVS